MSAQSQAANFGNNFANNSQQDYFTNMQKAPPSSFHDPSLPNATSGQFQPPQQSKQQPQYFNPLQGSQVNNFLNDPVASMAVKYGSTLADQGKEYVAQNVIKRGTSCLYILILFVNLFYYYYSTSTERLVPNSCEPVDILLFV